MDTDQPPHHRPPRARRAGGGRPAGTISLTAWGINRAVTPSVDAGGISIATVRVGYRQHHQCVRHRDPVHEELVSSPIQTRVAKVHAKLGQQVQANELLLELDSRTIQLAIDALKEQLAQQENRILALTLEMEQKRKQLSSAIELLELDLQANRVKLGRYQTLRKAGGVSAEDLLTAELNVSATRSSCASTASRSRTASASPTAISKARAAEKHPAKAAGRTAATAGADPGARAVRRHADLAAGR
jgi:HlyD family secretion protein